jgi:perosamine synthetase
VFQDPNYKRHDAFGYNYRMPEVAAAVALAQLEKIDSFIKLRIDISKMYVDVMNDCDYLVPQKTPEGYKNTSWTCAVKYLREDVSWQDFRKKYVEYGGDGIYAAWALLYEETLFTSDVYKKRCPWIYNDLSYKKGICPVAEKVQPTLMQFVNNYSSIEEAKPYVMALSKTIKYFK